MTTAIAYLFALTVAAVGYFAVTRSALQKRRSMQQDGQNLSMMDAEMLFATCLFPTMLLIAWLLTNG